MRYSVLISSLIISAGMAYGAVPTNEAERLEMDRFINELLSKMTLRRSSVNSISLCVAISSPDRLSKAI